MERPGLQVITSIVAAALLSATAVFAATAGEYISVDVSTKPVDGGRALKVVAVESGETLVGPIGRPLVGPSECEVEYELVEVDGGFDLQLTIHNPTDGRQKRPAIVVRGIKMGTNFHYIDGRSLGHTHEKQVGKIGDDEGEKGRSRFSYRISYPDDLYAPVTALWNERFAVGMSLIYDIFDQQHAINARYWSEGGGLAGNLAMGFELQQPFPDWKQPPQSARGHESLPSGATEQYRLSVRFAKPVYWLDTLEPYGNYFEKRFGPVRYDADLRPVFGEPTALTKFCDVENNPRGYNPKTRLDLVGWEPYVDHVRQRAVSNGYRRIMVWCPSGLYTTGSNYPPEFMTEWPQKLVETLPQLLSLKEKGVSIGMWWGRSSQVSGGWNSGKMWVRDLEDDNDVRAAYAELDLAAKRGTDEVGLDAFKYIPLWQRYSWLQKLKKRYPDMRFITESADCDIMHTIAPTFMPWRRQHYEPVLADYLNAGHESWIRLRWQQVNRQHFDKLVNWGLVPVTMSRAVVHDASNFAGGGQ